MSAYRQVTPEELRERNTEAYIAWGMYVMRHEYTTESGLRVIDETAQFLEPTAEQRAWARWRGA